MKTNQLTAIFISIILGTTVNAEGFNYDYAQVGIGASNYKSSPLPKAKKELFDRDLTFYFKVKGDIDVIKSVREKAKKGDPMSMRIVDDMGQYLEGMAALEAHDYRTAFVKWLPLAEKNDKKSQYNLGFIYSLGKGVNKDLSKSFYWYSKAAESGHVKAQYGIA